MCPASVQVCHLLQPINHPEQGGPLTDAPPYDCGARKATATLTANTYKFDVSGLVTDKMVAVAILPTGPGTGMQWNRDAVERYRII